MRELDFLEVALGNKVEQYKNCPWLKSKFDSDIWMFEFEGFAKVTSVDFNIDLEDGYLLTSNKHRRILKTIKYWILSSLHTDGAKQKGLQYSAGTAYNAFVTTCQTIDYFLMRGLDLNISTIGFIGLMEDNIREFFADINSSNQTSYSIYKFNEKLSYFLSFRLANSDSLELKNVLEKSEYDLKHITQTQINDNELSISLNDVPLIRAWLLKEGYYRYASQMSPYQLVPHISKLSGTLFKNTLRGKTITNVELPLLCVEIRDFGHNEFPAIPVRDEDDYTPSQAHISKMQNSLRNLFSLHNHEFKNEQLMLPALELLDTVNHPGILNGKKGRFKTLPFSVALDSIKNAIEFHLEYGNDLIKSYENLLDKLSKCSLDNKKRATLPTKDFIAVLTPKIRDIGVKYWAISKNRMAEKSKASYFSALRGNEGLSDLIRVYIGATAIVVGALTARRVAELEGLISGESIDSTGGYIIFDKAKSTQNLYGLRQRTARPIDNIAVDMIRQVERIQNALIRCGYIDQLTSLFAYPTTSAIRIKATSRKPYYRAVDSFCDYFETPVVENSRYYIRQHQLRRFFAMVFFWGNGFGGLDTLRWFLGHTDPEHLYHYITETCDGEILKDVKIQYATETLSEHCSLAELVKKRYGTEDFTLLESSEIESYIEELIDEGGVEIEPEFFETADGIKYKIVVRVRGTT